MKSSLARPPEPHTLGGPALGRDALERLSHELRTPLTVIQLAGHLLERSARDAGAKAPLEHLSKAALRLGDVIEDLLLLARLRSPEAGLSSEPFPLAEALEAAVAAAEPLARGRGAAFEVQVRAASAEVRGEPGVVVRAVGHLLANAVLFGPSGGRVSVALEPLQRGYEISVADDGPGVPAHLIADLFRPFYQPSDLMTREVGGLGLGLTLVSLTAQRLGGAVTAFSRVGAGSRFGLWLPAAGR